MSLTVLLFSLNHYYHVFHKQKHKYIKTKKKGLLKQLKLPMRCTKLKSVVIKLTMHKT